MQKAISLMFLALSFSFLTGFGDQYSKLIAKSEIKNGKMELSFQVVPNSGLIISHEAPWSITLTQTQGLKLELTDGKHLAKNFDEKIPGFLIKSDLDPKAKSGKIEYSLKAFVCTEDKKHCYPQFHKGSLDWKK